MGEGEYIMLVDDDDRNIFALSAVLRSRARGMKVIVARDGQQCLDLLRQNNNMSVVLLDMMMPIMDGYQTLKEIRNDDNLKHLLVIALTAQAMKGDMERCIEAGADDYCSKPVNIDELLKKIELVKQMR